MQHIAYKRHKKSLYNAFQIRIKEAIALTLDLFMEAKTMYEDQERQLQDRHTYLQKLELSQDHVRKWRDERIRQLRISTERAGCLRDPIGAGTSQKRTRDPPA
ncbi:hypothetical protein BASA81_015985 [Batrachochytrium salamandrivorans]|nr:hypothetical protein BASA81_015985 [Batrachochytrium salamandrivorans]